MYVIEHEADAPPPAGVHDAVSSDPAEADQATVSVPPGVIGEPFVSSTVAVQVEEVPTVAAPQATVVPVGRSWFIVRIRDCTLPSLPTRYPYSSDTLPDCVSRNRMPYVDSPSSTAAWNSADVSMMRPLAVWKPSRPCSAMTRIIT